MRLSQADRRRGFKDEDASALAYVRSLARQRGIDPTALHRFEGQYLAQHRSWSGSDREQFIRRAAEGVGLQPHDVDATFDDIDSVAESGEFPDIREPVPSPGEDQRRLAEISDILRNDRHQYDKLNLGDEAQDIRARLGSEAGMSVPTDTHVSVDAPARASRVEEIKTMMRDQASPYWRGSRSESLQAEYRALHAEPTDQPTGGGTRSVSEQPQASADNQTGN